MSQNIVAKYVDLKDDKWSVEASLEQITKDLDASLELVREACYLDNVIAVGNEENITLAVEHFGLNDTPTKVSMEGLILDTLKKIWKKIVEFFTKVAVMFKKDFGKVKEMARELIEERPTYILPRNLLARIKNYQEFSKEAMDNFEQWDIKVAKPVIELMKFFSKEQDAEKLANRYVEFTQTEAETKLLDFFNNVDKLADNIVIDRNRDEEIRVSAEELNDYGVSAANLYEYGEYLFNHDLVQLSKKLNSIKNGTNDTEFRAIHLKLVTTTKAAMRVYRFATTMFKDLEKLRMYKEGAK